MTIKKARKLLGNKAIKMKDKEILRIIDKMQSFAVILLSRHPIGASTKINLRYE
jgi:hypothetical protein